MSKPYRFPQPLLFALPVMVLLAAGCGANDPVAPGIEPEIVNTVDNFQFQVSAMTNYSGTLEYTWSNTGALAVVDQACAISDGTATLFLFDDTGAQVYSRSLTEGGSIASNAGTSGSWTIRLLLSQTTGTLNFRVDKATP